MTRRRERSGFRSHLRVGPGAAASLLAATGLLAGIGCGPSSETAAPERAGPGDEAPRAAPPAPGPGAPRAAQPAAPAGGGDPVAGRSHYQRYCASCHGATGEGDGPVARALDPKPARHSDGAYMNGLSDEYLLKVIREGGPAVGKSPNMAAWGGVLDERALRDVLAYVRSLADPPYEP